jgi:hypothetical protein
MGDIEGLKSIMAPAGEKTYSVRIMGTGRVMLSMNDAENVSLIPVRHPEDKETHSWEDLADTIATLIPDFMTMEEAYKEITGQDYPVQEPEKLAKKKESRFTKAKTEPEKTKTDTEEPKTEPEKEGIAPVQQPEQVLLNDFDSNIPAPDPQETEESDAESTENTINTECEEEIPGQDTIMNHPEYIPEEMTEIIPPENAIKTECEEDSDQAAGISEDDKHIIAGFKSGIASGIRRLEQLYKEERWNSIVEVAKDIQWRAEQIARRMGNE